MELTTGSQATTHAFDIAYEASSDDAIVIYRGDTSATLYYNTYSSGTWSGQSSTTSASMTTAPSVIQADSNPNNDWIIVGVVDGSLDFELFMWDGSSWTAIGEQSAGVTYTASIPIDVAFNKKTGMAMAIYGEGSSVRYRTIPNGSTTESAEQTLEADLDDTAANLRLESSQLEDTMYAAMSNRHSALGTATWNGSVWNSQGIVVGGTSGQGGRYYRFLAISEHFTTQPPTSTYFGLNISNGAAIKRGEFVTVYSRWDDLFRDTIIEPAYTTHNGPGTDTQYITPHSGIWVNSSLNISNTTTFPTVGRVDVQNIEAKDIGGYGQTNYVGWFFIYDYSFTAAPPGG